MIFVLVVLVQSGLSSSTGTGVDSLFVIKIRTRILEILLLLELFLLFELLLLSSLFELLELLEFLESLSFEFQSSSNWSWKPQNALIRTAL